MQLELHNVSKKYKSNLLLSNISLTVQEGTIFCLVGKNGAGKSTLFEIILSLVKADTGNILVNGALMRPNSNTLKKITGAAIGTGYLPEGLTLNEYLRLLGSIYNIDPSACKERSKQLRAFFYRNDEEAAKPMKYFSSGMKQKAALCAALLHNPGLLLLDEPFTFLDPAASTGLCSLLQALAQKGKTILIASHDLLYIDKIATHIGVLNNQDFIFNGTYAEFKNSGNLLEQNSIIKNAFDYNTGNTEALIAALDHT
jgi:ABC-2 type transport system ATP-binding protein